MSKSTPKNSTPLQWTAQQAQAISHDGSSVLVSAAAGAGKTEVLAQHCAHLLANSTPPCAINELLVVTFTDAAAAQMRQRIGRIVRELSDRQPDNNHLAQQAARVSTAAISTIHSFCQTVLRQNFAQAKLDPQFKIADPDQAMLLKNTALEEVFEQFYLDTSATGQTFRNLVDMYGSGEDTGIQKLVLRLHNFLTSLVSPQQWCEKALQWLEPKGDRPSRDMLKVYGELLAQKCQHSINISGQNAGKIRELLQRRELRELGPEKYAKLESFEKLLAKLIDNWQKFLGQIEKGQFEDLTTTVQQLSVKKPSSPRPKDESAKNLIAEIKGLFAEAASSKNNKELLNLITLPLNEQAQALAQSFPYARMIIELANSLDRRYARAKQAENLLDFTDLERRCLDLLNEGTPEEEELIPSAVAQQLQQRFRYLLVDEYQDINPLQNAILRLLSRELSNQPGNLFAVGDLKQSIYRFRLAEPQVFQDRLAQLASSKLDRVIDLQSNFRSRVGIINGVNLVFERLMKSEPAGIIYDQHARLKPGQVAYEKIKNFESPSFIGPAVEFHLLTRQNKRKSPADDESAAEYEEHTASEGETATLHQTQQEALLLARRIRHLMGLEKSTVPVQVMDKDPATGQPCYRPIAYRDIAVLLRVTTRQADVFAQVLRQMDIPVYADAETGYFATTEIQDMLALLEVLDNPFQDIPLAALLRSPIAGFEADDLAQIRLTNKDLPFHQAVFELAQSAENADCDQFTAGLSQFCRQLQDWRKLLRDLPLPEAIWEIYQQTNYLHYVAGLPGGPLRQANLLKLHERARQFSSFTRTSLARFLQFLRDLQQRQADLKLAPAISEADDVVRIISVHKSKGLEFPVVILPTLSHKFNFTDAQGNIIIDRQRYLGLHYVDRRQRLSYPTLSHLLAEANIKRHVLAEEMRLLYVALTRAKEHLILIGSGTDKQLQPFTPELDPDQLTPSQPPESSQLAAARSWLDWLVPTLASLPSEDLQFVGPTTHPKLTDCQHTFVVSAYEPHTFDEDIFAEDFGRHHRRAGLTLEQIASLQPPAQPAQPDKELDKSLSLIERPYHYAEFTNMPAVVSASERKRLFEPSIDEDLDPLTRTFHQPEELPQLPDLLSAKPPTLSATQIGSVNHLFLQKIDFTRPCHRQDLQQQAQQLAKLGLFDESALAALDIEAAESFFAGEIGQTILANPSAVYREIPFILAIAPGELAEGVQAEFSADKPIVRGIIDLLIIQDDQATIVDFKTDRVSGPQLRQRAKAYAWQMQMYSRAVQDILGRPVTQKILYFLTPRELLTID